MRVGWIAVGVLLGIGHVGAAAVAHKAAAQKAVAPTAPANPANERLLKMSPQDRAGWLARTVGQWCIATDPFLMGVAETGAAAGNAYWSFNCVGYGSFIVQLEPRGHGVTIDCATFKEQGGGKECFKKF